jgi:hypothetical protein
MKRYTAKLCSETSVRSFKINFLILIVQFIVMSKNVCGGKAFARSNLDNLANLNDSIRCQLMQLHLELAQNIQEDRVQRHAETSSEEIFKYHHFILM